MPDLNLTAYRGLAEECDAAGVTLVAVSKTHPVEAIQQLYDAGHRVFGENRVQELLAKKHLLPDDIRWHLIGHLQTNKVKQCVTEVAMIESVDSIKLLHTLEKEAGKAGVIVDILLQVKIAEEETKFGFDPPSLEKELRAAGVLTMQAVNVRGVMGMASFIDDEDQVRREFRSLKMQFEGLRRTLFGDKPGFDQISMGMSGDYQIAIAEGSTMVRVGSLIFGERVYDDEPST